jgi:hypothetical protein
VTGSGKIARPTTFAERILLSIQAVIGGLDIEPVVMDRRSRVRRWEEANDVRREPDGAVRTGSASSGRGRREWPSVASA